MLAVLAIASGCGVAPELDTRTFELQYLQPAEAVEMVIPYVYDDRPDGPGMVTPFSSGITVRETADNLEKIARVLEEYDRPKPGVRLLFQLIQANGAEAVDPRIRDVEQALRELFRFEGYELVAETQLGAVVGSGSTQVFGHEGVQYAITAHIQNVREKAGAGAVELHVELMSNQIGRAMTTAMTVPVGRTVVLGSTQPDPERAALILTVRPELVTLSEAGS